MDPTSSPQVRRIVQPQYQKLSVILIGLVALFYALSMAAPVVVPLLFALLLAILLNPVVNRMCKWRFPRTLAIAIAVVLAMMLLAGLAYFIVTQAVHLADSMPQMEKKLDAAYGDAQQWAQRTFNMKRSEVKDAVEKVKDEGVANGGSFVGRTLTTVGTLFAFFFLLPVFTFLILLYKRLLITFTGKLFKPKDQDTVQDVLLQTRTVVQSYLIGLMLEAMIVATLNWIGLTVIGVQYALLLAILGALLNLIPYIGMIIATVLPMAIALATLDPTAALWVLGLYLFVQFIDNNFIVPHIVASRVELNALVSIIVVMIGGALWGVPGMFLALPLTALLKVVFDRVPSLQPFGYVLGDDDQKDYRELFTVKALQRTRK